MEPVDFFLAFSIGVFVMAIGIGVFQSTHISEKKITSGREFQIEHDLWQCVKTKELPYTRSN